MTSTAYKKLAIPYFKEVFIAIDNVMKEVGAPYYLVGVNAIALELLKKGIKPGRGTKDIDFAVMVSTIKEYENIIDAMVDKGFNKVKAPWTLYHQEFNVAIDILPFGEIEENDTISFNERYSDLHVLGFKEILENATNINIDEITVEVPPIPGMVILKLVAWSDRPEERDNDLSDIIRIIKHYFDYEWDTIIDNHFDLFAEEPIDRLKIASRVLGRQAKKYMDKSSRLKQRILETLEANLGDVERSEIAKEWTRRGNLEEKNSNLEYSFQLLSEFEKGLRE